MGSIFKTLSVTVVMIWWCCILILAILLLSLLKVLIIIVLFMALVNLKQFIYYKILCLMIMGKIKCMSKKSILKIESTTIYVRLMPWSNTYKHCKSCKKDIRMVGLVHATRWEKRSKTNFFIDKKYYKVVGIAIGIRLKKCVIKIWILLFLQYNLFLNTVRLKKWLIYLFILFFLHLSLFLMNKSFLKSVMLLFLKILLC